MEKSFIRYCLILIVFFIGCKPKPESLKFTGITHTDKLGTIEGKPDTSDWRSDDIFTQRENALFNGPLTKACNPQKIRIVFYPNPCRTKSTLFAFKDSTVRLAIRLVDKDLNVIMSNDSIMKAGLELNLSSYKTDDTLRLYYKFISKDGCESNGHGDIYVNPYK